MTSSLNGRGFMKFYVLNDFSYYNDLVAEMLLHKYDDNEWNKEENSLEIEKDMQSIHLCQSPFYINHALLYFTWIL